MIPTAEWYLSEREHILPTTFSFLSGKDETNNFKTMWITSLIHKGARSLKVDLIRLVQINKSSVVSGFPKQSESFGADGTANKPKNTAQHLGKTECFLSHIYIPNVPNIPAGQRESWLWLVPRKWERHNRYTRMHCGNKRRDLFFLIFLNSDFGKYQ